jgi:hypothetical protein
MYETYLYTSCNNKHVYNRSDLSTAVKSALFHKLEDVSDAARQGMFSLIFRETGGSTVGFH